MASMSFQNGLCHCNDGQVSYVLINSYILFLLLLCLYVILYNYNLLLRSIRVFMDLKNDIHRSP